MKLGLICLFTVAALVTRVLGQDYYLASVFVLGINVGEKRLGGDGGSTNQKDPVTEKNLKTGSVRFRFMLFKTTRSPGDPDPIKNKKVNWVLSYFTDFDLSFEQLKLSFTEKFFESFSIKGSFLTYSLRNKGSNVSEIKDASFAIQIDYEIFKTEGTHVVSLITDSDSLKEFTMSVRFTTELEIHLSSSDTPNAGFTHNFLVQPDKLEPKETWQQKCPSNTKKSKFVMKSEKVSSKDGDEWKGVKSKVLSGFYEKKEVIRSYISFGVNAGKILASVILVLNYIPIKRFHKNSSSSWEISYDFDFEVYYDDLLEDFAVYSDNVKRTNNIWDVNTKKTNDNFSERFVTDVSLFSKWETDLEPISLTALFECWMENQRI